MPASSQLLAFVLFSAVAAGTPGPSNALLVATSARVGVLRGLPALFGTTVGMGLMMFVVAFGLGAIIFENPVVLTAVRWVGAAFMLWLAWRIATSGRHEGQSDGRPIGFFGMAAFQWVNPKSWLVCAGASATFLDPRGGNAFIQAVVLGVTFAVVATPSCLPWLAFGGAVQRLLRTDHAARIFNLAMGGLLAASVLLFFL